MNRRPYWPALIHVIAGIFMLVLGANFMLPLFSAGISFPFILFPVVWLGMALFFTIRSLMVFWKGPGTSAPRPMSGDYRSPYIKNDPADAPPPGSPSAAERLRQLDTMRQSGLITDAEFEKKKAAILRDL